MKPTNHKSNSIKVDKTIEKFSKTFSIVVCYQPDKERLNLLCKQLIVAGSGVILVDNTEEPYLDQSALLDGCILLTLGCNRGIAYAQNIGIDTGILNGGEIFAFFDQDSQVNYESVSLLVSELIIGKPGIVSPICLDNLSHEELPAQIIDSCGMTRPKFYNGGKVPYFVDIVISSGTTCTKEAFKIVGKFDNDLFIDYVDIDWCLRCREKNIPIKVVPSAVIYHRIGSKTVNLGPINMHVHSPERCYYQIRNSLNLFRKPHVTFILAAQLSVSTILNRLFLIFLMKQKKYTYMKLFFHAIYDGLLGVVGPLKIK